MNARKKSIFLSNLVENDIYLLYWIGAERSKIGQFDKIIILSGRLTLPLSLSLSLSLSQHNKIKKKFSGERLSEKIFPMSVHQSM